MQKVLLIDSDLESIGGLAEVLRGAGIACALTGDGREGLQFAQDQQPSLIVLCVELNRVSGYSICNKLKKNSDLADIPLILTSTEASQADFDQHRRLNTRAEGYLFKPYDLPTVLGLMGGLIDLPAEVQERALQVTPPPSPVADDEDLDVSIEVDAADDVAATAVFSSAELDAVAAERGISTSGVSPLESDDDIDIAVDNLEKTGGADVSDDVDDDDGMLESPPPLPAEELLPPPVVVVEDVEITIEEPVTDDLEISISDIPIDRTAVGSEDGTDDELHVALMASVPRRVAVQVPGGKAADEVLQLRQRVRDLEALLEKRELEFSDRLLEESTRARQASELKNRLTYLEHELKKQRENANRSQGADQKLRQEVDSFRAALKEAQSSEVSLRDEVATLNASLSSVTEERNRLAAELEVQRRDTDTAVQEMERAIGTRKQALDAVGEVLGMLSDDALGKIYSE